MDRHRYNATRGSISEPLAEVTGAQTDDPAPQFLRGIAGQYIRGRANLERAIRLKTFRLDSDRATVARLEGKQRRSDRVAAKGGPGRLKPLPARANQLLNLSLQHRSLQKALRDRKSTRLNSSH